MPNRSTDALFQLVHSLQKQEKRNFKLYVKRNSSNEDMKIIQLFDALDAMNEYDEEVLLRKASSLKKQQLSNTKAHLYKQVLASLRVLENKNIDIQLHEQLDNARILYNKGLYLQSLKILDKIKETAKANNQISLLVQVLFLEKKIESLHITRSLKDRAAQLIGEADDVNERLVRITKLSNLALQLYSWYINNGHARNEKDEREIENYFQTYLSDDLKKANGFYEKLYLYQSYCWYAFIRQDFLMYYRYTQHWVDLFHQEPLMIEIETASYIKGMHNLLTAHFTLRNYSKFEKDVQQFEKFAHSDIVKQSDNNRIQVFVYLYIAKVNQHILDGTFTEGLLLVPTIEEKLNEFQLHLDRHRILVFYYKIASLYFGAAEFGSSIDYLNKIINWKVDLRNDLQCYARLLHLIAHYELGNFDLMEYLVKSVYRFMAKMENLSLVEEEMFKFLRKSFHLSPKELKPQFEKLLEKLKQFEKNRFETRAFVYLDIISWLESKVFEKPVYEIIREKYLERKKVV
ncbi:MAG: hypothetical protein JWO92_761 [Chitinophagaceae bacterium]|nr:hypothetical protein [Chitinophagaceae bacterium]MDB5223603.1 hypothetical protein [Chitinophagaceae bacterium]